MLYPATYDPPLSVEVAQARETVVCVVVDTKRFPGTVGAMESTVTVVVAVEVPTALVAVSVYIVVEVGLTFVEAMRVEVEKEPGVIATDEAFVTLKESVEVPADTTIEDEAMKEDMVGGGGGFVVACVLVLRADTFPTPSKAETA
jgi:hypothetical protein